MPVINEGQIVKTINDAIKVKDDGIVPIIEDVRHRIVVVDDDVVPNVIDN